MAIGGTFDVFHRGHEQLIIRAFGLGDRVLIGMTSDMFARKLRKIHPVQHYSHRIKAVRKFLRNQGWSTRATIASLADPFGPARTMEELGALVITRDTLRNARKLNSARVKSGLRPVKIIRVALAKADDGFPISSTRIRNGEIDSEGHALSKRRRS